MSTPLRFDGQVALVKIQGEAQADGALRDVLELTGLQGEFRLIRKALG
jgi:hypothetical protein